MGLKWESGKDITRMAVDTRVWFEGVKDEAYGEMEKSAEIGGGLIQDYLEAAHTGTGIQRAMSKKGGFPGRHLTGNMVSSVSYGSAQASRSRRFSLFGWFAGEFERYFLDQDRGGKASQNQPEFEALDPSIPEANALPNAFGRAREVFRARLLAMGLKRR